MDRALESTFPSKFTGPINCASLYPGGENEEQFYRRQQMLDFFRPCMDKYGDQLERCKHNWIKWLAFNKPENMVELAQYKYEIQRFIEIADDNSYSQSYDDEVGWVKDYFGYDRKELIAESVYGRENIYSEIHSEISLIMNEGPDSNWFMNYYFCKPLDYNGEIDEEININE